MVTDHGDVDKLPPTRGGVNRNPALGDAAESTACASCWCTYRHHGQSDWCNCDLQAIRPQGGPFGPPLVVMALAAGASSGREVSSSAPLVDEVDIQRQAGRRQGATRAFEAHMRPGAVAGAHGQGDRAPRVAYERQPLAACDIRVLCGPRLDLYADSTARCCAENRCRDERFRGTRRLDRRDDDRLPETENPVEYPHRTNALPRRSARADAALRQSEGAPLARSVSAYIPPQVEAALAAPRGRGQPGRRAPCERKRCDASRDRDRDASWTTSCGTATGSMSGLPLKRRNRPSAPARASLVEGAPLSWNRAHQPSRRARIRQIAAGLPHLHVKGTGGRREVPCRGAGDAQALCSPLALSSVTSLHFLALPAPSRAHSRARNRRTENAPVLPPAREFARISPFADWSGRWDLNPRHSAWEADALPTELRPLAVVERTLGPPTERVKTTPGTRRRPPATPPPPAPPSAPSPRLCYALPLT